MKKILMLMFVMIFFVSIVSALNLQTPDNIYLNVNTTYPLILVPLDENVYNVSLNIYDENWTTLNFTWTGEKYTLNILFQDIGDYPFVVNSTDVNGSLTGKFLVRESFEVTFNFFKSKQSYPFFSNKYINQYAYVTAELTGEKSFFNNQYDDNLEGFIAPISDSRFKKPVWYSRLNNGKATLTLYEGEEYAIRIIDGIINFDGEYSVPNVTKSYGTNIYVGKYDLSSDEEYDVLLTKRTLNPYRWLANWVMFILIVFSVISGIFLFFVLPDFPVLSFGVGLGFSILFIIIRIVLFLWVGV